MRVVLFSSDFLCGIFILGCARSFSPQYKGGVAGEFLCQVFCESLPLTNCWWALEFQVS